MTVNTAPNTSAKSGAESPSVAVVLVNWNNEEDTAECLASLAEQTFDDFHVIVVDNGSRQESLGYLTDRYSWPTYLRNEQNRGFTGGNNRGIQYAREIDSEWILLLNNDTTVEPSFLSELVEAAENRPEDVGIIGPTVHTYESNKVWSAGGYVNGYTGNTAHRTLENDGNGDQIVDYVVGAAMLIHDDVFEDVGTLDDDFFIYYEETEFCRRAAKAGWNVLCVPVDGVYHKESVDYKFSSFREYYFTRNRWLFVQKTQPLHRRLFFYPYFFLRWVVLQIGYLLVVDRNPAAARATLKAALHAVIGKTGKLEE